MVYGPRHPHPLDPRPRKVDELWKAIRDDYGSPERIPPCPPYNERAQELLEGLRDELTGVAPLATTTTAERELYRAALLMFEGRSAPGDRRRAVRELPPLLVPFWVRRFGVRLATEAVFSTLSYGLGESGLGRARRLVVSEHPGSWSPWWATSLGWLLLRREIAGDVAAARQAVGDLSLPVEAASVWGGSEAAHEKVRSLIAAGKMESEKDLDLLSAISDPELALRFAELQLLYNARRAAEQAFQLVDRLGAEAAPVLLALLARVNAGDRDMRALAQAAVLADAAHCRAVVIDFIGATSRILHAALKDASP